MTVSEEPLPVAAPSPAPVHWRKLHALGLPGGSVRALLAVAVCGAIWVWLWLRPEREVPRYLQDLMFIIMGHYFAARARGSGAGAAALPEEAGPPPLFLPRGTIRIVLVAGFLAVAGVLIHRHRLWVTDPAGRARLNPAGVTLLLAIGFLVGVVLGKLREWWAGRRKGRPLPRVVEDVRAVVSLAAAAALLLIVFGLWSPEKGNATLVEIKRFFANSHIEEVLAAVVGFYFGSRS